MTTAWVEYWTSTCEAGLTQVVVTLALAAARKLGVKLDSLHLDSSSFDVHGEYANVLEQGEHKPAAIEITYGYSRDHRPDLKQFPRGLDVQWRWRSAIRFTGGRWE